VVVALGTVVDDFLTDFRHAFRALARMPVLAGVVVLSLAVGIGVNTVVFSWIQARIFKPVPGAANAAGLSLVEIVAETGSFPGSSWREYEDLKDRLPAFDDLVAFRMSAFNVGEAGRLERTYGLLVSGNYFSALGLRPAAGRFFGPDEAARPGVDPVVVVSYDYWQTHYAGAQNAVGRRVRTNGQDLTIVGVAPLEFQGTILSLQFDFWVPATMAPSLIAGSRELEDRGARGYQLMGRLGAGASRARAQTELVAALADLARLHPESNAGIRGEVRPFWQQTRGPQGLITTAVVVLQGLMLLLLLAVCGNTANLLLARASARHREVGVRLAIGAGAWSIVRLMMVEYLVMALTGALLGAALAVWGTEALRAVPIVSDLPVRFQTSIDGVALLFAVALGGLCALLFGAVPALQLSRVAPLAALHAGPGGPARSRVRHSLMAIEVALAIVVLVTAGIFVTSFNETREADPGFRKEGVLLAAYDLTGRNLDAAYVRDFADRLLDRLRELPDVESAAVASAVPLDIHGLPLRAFEIDGRVREGGGVDRALTLVVSADYLATMGIPLLSGRDFVDFADAAAPPQVIVNEEFVRRFIGDREPLGRRVRSGGREYFIAGVAANSLYEAFGEPVAPFVYFSYRDRPSFVGQIHVRAGSGREAVIATALRSVVKDLDPTVPLFSVRTLSEHVETNQFFRRIPARMFVVLGPLLLVLAATGIYAVVAYSVARRTMEIGVRLALGGTARQIVAGIVRETLRPVAAGVIAGWTLVFMVYIHVLPGRPLSAGAFFGVPIALLIVAALASWIPASRAARVDPMSALREE
jgi:predicted permease